MLRWSDPSKLSPCTLNNSCLSGRLASMTACKIKHKNKRLDADPTMLSHCKLQKLAWTSRPAEMSTEVAKDQDFYSHTFIEMYSRRWMYTDTSMYSRKHSHTTQTQKKDIHNHTITRHRCNQSRFVTSTPFELLPPLLEEACTNAISHHFCPWLINHHRCCYTQTSWNQQASEPFSDILKPTL